MVLNAVVRVLCFSYKAVKHLWLNLTDSRQVLVCFAKRNGGFMCLCWFNDKTCSRRDGHPWIRHVNEFILCMLNFPHCIPNILGHFFYFRYTIENSIVSSKSWNRGILPRIHKEDLWPFWWERSENPSDFATLCHDLRRLIVRKVRYWYIGKHFKLQGEDI